MACLQATQRECAILGGSPRRRLLPCNPALQASAPALMTAVCERCWHIPLDGSRGQPFVLEGGKYNEKADVYSYGVCMYELLTRCGRMKNSAVYAIPCATFSLRQFSLCTCGLELDVRGSRPDLSSVPGDCPAGGNTCSSFHSRPPSAAFRLACSHGAVLGPEP
eukprot:3772270-Amphidinium_carterae.1